MKKMIKTNKFGQEEMVGFALIIIVVSVILLVFLGITLSSSQKESVESYEVESFIQAILQYTTDCRDNLEYLSIRKLVFDCYGGGVCLDGRNTCEVLNSTLEGILGESWKIEGDRPIKGYKLEIISDEQIILSISKGNFTGNSKGAMQEFSKSGNLIDVFFTAFY